MAISEKAKKVTGELYRFWGSGSGYLFGIPPEHRWAVEVIVDTVLSLEEAEEEKECVTK